MNYDTMKAVDLKALCELRGLKVHRAKVDMIRELKEYDAAQEITDFYKNEPAPLPDGAVPASEDIPELRDHPAPESPAEGDVWLSDGSFYKRYDAEGPYLGDDEHEENLRDVVYQAEQRHMSPYGPPFRAASECGIGYWVYAVNVR